jgi:hypothetical protein
MSLNDNPEIVNLRKNKSQNGISHLLFPDDSTINNNYVMISFYRYERTHPLDPPTEAPIGRKIALPMPISGFEDNTNIKYDQQVMGAAIGGGILSGASSAGDKLKYGGSALARTALGLGADLAAGMVGLPANAGKAAIELTSGTINNPNITLTFQGVSLREHTFTWRLIPKNGTESQRIKDIIWDLKTNGLPRKTGSQSNKFSLSYPSIAKIKFFPDIIKMSDLGCFISDISVKYDSDGHPSFFTDNTPVVTDLTVKFVERYIVDATDYDGGVAEDFVTGKDILDKTITAYKKGVEQQTENAAFGVAQAGAA